MVPPNLFFWSISQKRLETRGKQALRNKFLRTILCPMTILIPGTIGKGSVEREHPFLTEFVLNMNSCFIQYNGSLVENVNVAQKINSFCQE